MAELMTIENLSLSAYGYIIECSWLPIVAPSNQLISG